MSIKEPEIKRKKTSLNRAMMNFNVDQKQFDLILNCIKKCRSINQSQSHEPLVNNSNINECPGNCNDGLTRKCIKRYLYPRAPTRIST